MKTTYNWLKDFVELSLAPEELADKLTMAGLEVTSLERFEDDYVFEIEITSNRADWLSVMGIAREAAAITGGKLKIPKTPERGDAGKNKILTLKDKRLSVKVEDKKACPFYSARVITDVKVKPSADWIARRLRAIGLRPINNIVDIANYVLYTAGQPLHAFDLDKIGRGIIVRFAFKGEELITIDGAKRRLSDEILVIADKNKPLAIAGIMGGRESEVNENTRNILLESAYFSPLIVRKGRRLLAFSSDSSYRFERSVDIEGVLKNSDFAASMIQRYASGALGEVYKSGAIIRKSKKIISFNPAEAAGLLGKDIPLSKAKGIFQGLGFKADNAKGGLLRVRPRSYRQDIGSETDLIEELCRIFGYEKIPESIPAVRPQSINEDINIGLQKKAAGILSGLGYNQAITYSLLSRDIINKSGYEPENTRYLENPLSAEQEVLRPGLLAGLLLVLAGNLELGNSGKGFFEIGNCFYNGREFKELSVMETSDILDLKGRVEFLLAELGVKEYSFRNISDPFFAPGQAAALRIYKQDSGAIGSVNREVLRRFKIDSPRVCGCRINLDKIREYADFKKTFKVIPRYPPAKRDLSLLIEEGVQFGDISRAIRRQGIKELEGISLKDIYRSGAIPAGKKSLTLSLEFRSPDSTLTDLQVGLEMENIIRILADKFNARVR